MNKVKKLGIVGKNLIPNPSWYGHIKKEKYISTLPTGSNQKNKKRCNGILCYDLVITKRAQIPHSDDECEACFVYDIKKSLSWMK